MSQPQQMAAPGRGQPRLRANAGAGNSGQVPPGNPVAAPAQRPGRANPPRGAAQMQNQGVTMTTGSPAVSAGAKGVAVPGLVNPALQVLGQQPLARPMPGNVSAAALASSQQQLQLAALYQSGHLGNILGQRVASGQMSREQAENMSRVAQNMAQQRQAQMHQSTQQLQSGAGMGAGLGGGAAAILAAGGLSAATNSAATNAAGQLNPAQVQTRQDLLRTLGTPGSVRPVEDLRRQPPGGAPPTRPIAAIPKEFSAPLHDPKPNAISIFGANPTHGWLVPKPPPAGLAVQRTFSSGLLGPAGSGPPQILQMPDAVGEGERLAELVAKVGVGERLEPEAEEVGKRLWRCAFPD